MAAKNQTAVPADGTANEEREKPQERKFPLETLRRNCVKLFGCTSSTFEGTFFNADKEKEYSIAEAKSIIEKWMKRGIGK